MKIFIMRHGEAEMMANSDKQRTLTAHGVKQASAQGEWLKTQLKSTALSLDKILVSPYIRTQQTFAQIDAIFEHHLEPISETWDGITPYGNPETVCHYLSVLEEQGIETVLIISHLPLVGEIVAELCGKNPVSFYPATVAEIEWQDEKGRLLQTKAA